MSENEKSKKKNFEEMSKDIDAKISETEDALGKLESSLEKTKEKVKRLKDKLNNLREKKKALFGDKICSEGIRSFSELDELLALHHETNPTKDEDSSRPDEGAMM